VTFFYFAFHEIGIFREQSSSSQHTQCALRTVRFQLWQGTHSFDLGLADVIFPVGAGLVRNPTSLPRWWGIVDVALAFAVAVGAFGIQMLGHGNLDNQAERTHVSVYRSSLHAILLVGVLVMLAGDRIKWASCATGFLWRTWLFLYILPWWLAAAGRTEIVDPMRSSSSRIDH
jgi:hypothetical protein